jgi:hypothetical protein
MGAVECLGTIDRVMPEAQKSNKKTLLNYGKKEQILKINMEYKDTDEFIYKNSKKGKI